MKNRIEKLRKKTEEERFILTYEWVKTGVIDLREFLLLMRLFEKKAIYLKGSQTHYLLEQSIDIPEELNEILNKV